MIIHSNVCTQCGNQSEIDKNTKAFQIVLKSYALSQHNFNDRFSNDWLSSTKKPINPPDQVDWANESFCDKECFIEYLKEKMNDNGMFRMTKEELQQMEEQQPREIKELKRVAKALSDLEQASSAAIMGAHNAKSK